MKGEHAEGLRKALMALEGPERSITEKKTTG
jgi:hypothetical protein